MRILLLLNQVPQDPNSGAAHSMRSTSEFLAINNVEINALATTATERTKDADHDGILRQILPLDTARVQIEGGIHQALHFSAAGVRYHLLDTGNASPNEWENSHGQTFDNLFDKILRQYKPNIVFTFGGSPAERARQQRARQAGSKVVFGLRNLGYLAPGAFDHADAILTGSQFVTDRYRSVLGIDSTPLPLPLATDDVLASEKQKIFITYVNPSFEKGVFFAARLFEEISLRRPDLPILVVESRANAGLLVAAGLTPFDGNPGFDLRRHENIMVSKPVARPADIFALARVAIMPSVWEEPAGRVAAEALLNGIPPIVSNRGGLPEVCNGGGFVMPMPLEVIAQPRSPVAPAVVQPWVDLLIRLADDEAFYEESCKRAAKAGEMYRQEVLAPRYVEFFRSVLEK
jgi:glycosyltransferase involved in cell wall biosynthesis